MARLIATLRRGECYYLRDIRLDRGVAVIIDEDMRAHLQEHAVDPVTTHDPNADEGDETQTSWKSKFEYEPYEGPLTVGSLHKAPKKVLREAEPYEAPLKKVRKAATEQVSEVRS